MKKLLVAVAIIIIVIFAIGVLKDGIIKSAVTVAATGATGAPVHIDGLSLGILNQHVRISGFKMYNPQGFSRDIFVDLSKIDVTYDLSALFAGKLHLTGAEIELKEMSLEKNKEGKLNVDALLKMARQERKEEAAASRQMPMRIDTIKLGIGRIIFKDYSAGKEPVVKVYDINIHKSYKDITGARQLAALILTEPMKSAGIEGAKIYGVAMLAGIGVLPVAIAAKFTGKGSAQQEFAASFDNAYAVSLAVLKQMGRITGEDKSRGIIDADISSTQVALKINIKSGNRTEVIVSARRYFFPKPEIAAGVLYEISEKLK
jgi:uncharacterized protein involved in outer membrane biogenesis